MQFRMNNTHIASINDNLIDNYRRLLNIPEEKNNTKLVREILYNQILKCPFNIEELNDKIEEANKYAKVHLFETLGEFIEYIMRKEIEDKLEICKNCFFYSKSGYCINLDVLTNPNTPNCGNNNIEITNPEIKKIINNIGKLSD